MHRLEFTRQYDYSCASGDCVLVPVTLRVGDKRVSLAASVDTGASYCLFGAEIAEALGLTLDCGIPLRFRTANSGFDAFGHEVEVSIFGITTIAIVYFFGDPMIDKNVLGRSGWLDRVRIGIVHHDSKVFLAPYDSGH